jgi:signal transduction histidine kinase
LIFGEFRPKAQKCKPFSALLTAITTTNATNNTWTGLQMDQLGGIVFGNERESQEFQYTYYLSPNSPRVIQLIPVPICMMRPFFTFIAIVICFTAVAANPKVDSLLKVVAVQADDSNKVLTLNELFKATLYADPRKSHEYILQAYNLAQRIEWEQGVAKMASNLGVYHSKQGNYEEALSYHGRVMAIRVRTNDSIQIANTHMNIGGVLYKQAFFEKGLAHFYKAIYLYKAFDDTTGVLAAMNNIATVRRELGELPEAQAAYLQVMRMQEVMGNPREAARTAMNIAGILQQQSHFDAAITWVQRGMHLADSLGDNFMRAAGYNSMAEIAISQLKFDEALVLLDSSKNISIRIGDSYSEAHSGMLMSDVFVHNKDTLQAEKSLLNSLEICRGIGRQQGTVATLARLGHLYVSLKRYQKAAEYLEEGLAISYEIHSPSLSRDILGDLSAALAGLGQFERAYNYHKDYSALDDSIYSEQRTGKISEMHERYEAGQKQRIIDQQNLEHTSDQLRIYRSRQGIYLLLIAVALAIISAGFIAYRYRQKLRTGKEIAIKNKEISAQRDYAELQNLRILQINTNLESLVEARTSAVVAAKHELDTFLYESAHALRRPITRIDGLLGLILDEKDPAVAADLREKLDLTLRKMDGLLHKLITVNEVSSRALRPEPLDVSRIVSQLSEEKVPAHFKFHNMVPPGLTLVSDGYFFRLVMASLIENAAAYHPSEPSHTPEIRVSAIENPAFVTVTVADNGLGIPREMQEKVFEMFVRGTVQGHGNGLGLYVAKAASERIHGKLACGDSHMGGSEFVFTVANRP